jgi:hypothetical protein
MMSVFMVLGSSVIDKWGSNMMISMLVVLFEYHVLVFGVRILGLTFIGCTYQQRASAATLLKVLSGDCDSPQGENPRSNYGGLIK